jgi:hypothetical protein
VVIAEAVNFLLRVSRKAVGVGGSVDVHGLLAGFGSAEFLDAALERSQAQPNAQQENGENVAQDVRGLGIVVILVSHGDAGSGSVRTKSILALSVNGKASRSWFCDTLSPVWRKIWLCLCARSSE